MILGSLGIACQVASLYPSEPSGISLIAKITRNKQENKLPFILLFIMGFGLHFPRTKVDHVILSLLLWVWGHRNTSRCIVECNQVVV